MKKILKIIFLVAVAASVVYVCRQQGLDIIAQLESRYLPCQQPIEYSLGMFNTRFGLTKNDFIGAINQAAQIWETPINRNLFEYSDTGSLKINLIYDYRQEATKKLEQLGIIVSDTQSSYDSIKSQYNLMIADYNSQKSALETRAATLQQRQDAYNAEVNSWNQRGGAPENIYNQLNQEKASINVEVAAVNQLQANLNARVADINAIVVALNQLANTLNLDVSQYNTIGGQQGSEFEEGNYQSGPDGQQIDIYQFSDRNKLIRVLAHELGHALGLDHVNDQKAIMYRLNNGVNEKLTATDLAELKSKCGIN